MHLNFVTLFDKGYLTKGIVLAESLARVTDDYTLYVFAFDDFTYEALKSINIPNVKVLKEELILDGRLKGIKAERTRAEYCWTCTSVVISYVMNTLGLDNCTYIDTDMLFWSDPRVLIDELVESGCSAQIVPHFFKKGLRTRLLKTLYGNYCVEFNTFIGDKGREVLEWWKERCLEDCYVDSPGGYYGDQKYLDFFQKKFDCVHVLENRGGGMGPWNVGQYSLSSYSDDGVLFEHGDKSYKLVFFHYQGMRNYDDCIYPGYKIWAGRKGDDSLIQLVYRKYVEELERAEAKYDDIINASSKSDEAKNIESSKRGDLKRVSLRRKFLTRLLSVVTLPAYVLYHDKDKISLFLSSSEENKAEKTHAPVAVFAYKRLDKIQRCINSLSSCPEAKDSEVFIFSDGPKTDEDEPMVESVREYLRTVADSNLFKSVTLIEQPRNKGLQNSIIEGVTDIINRYGKIIVLEDDLEVSHDFLDYMNRGLEFYKGIKDYGSVNANTYPLKQLKHYDKDIYVIRKADCWGWGTWADRWAGVDWDVKDYNEYKNDKKLRRDFNSLEAGLDKMMIAQQEGKISSWAVRWVYSLYKRNLKSVYPAISRTRNSGNDGSGENCGNDDRYYCDLYTGSKPCKFEVLDVDEKLARAVARFPRRRFKDVIASIKRHLRIK